MKNNKGYSLIEVLVTAMIIAIISAITVPAYRSYQKKSRRADCLTLLTNCSKAQGLHLSIYYGYSRLFCSSGATGLTPMDPKNELLPNPTDGYKSNYDLNVLSGSRPGTPDLYYRFNCGSYINFENYINRGGRAGTDNYWGGIFLPTIPAVGDNFYCQCAGNLDADNDLDRIEIDQDNITTIISDDI